MVRLVMTSLIKEGKVVRGWLGVSIQEVTSELAKQFNVKEGRGALVSDVLKATPAERAGLKRGDVIIRYNGREVTNASQLRNLVAETAVGQKLRLAIIRDRKELELEVRIDEQPKDAAALDTGPDGKAPDNTALAGLDVQELTPDLAERLGLPRGAAGMVVTQVEGGSAAEAAGVRSGDVIVEINRQGFKTMEDYRKVVRSLKAGESVLLLLSRNGQMLFLTVSP